MYRVLILTRSEERRAVVRELVRARAVHVTDHKKEQVSGLTIDIGSPDEAAPIISDTLTKTRSLLSNLPEDDSGERGIAEPATLSERIIRIHQLVETYATHEDALQTYEKELTRVDEARSVLELLPEIDVPIEALFSVRILLVTGETDRLTVALDPVFVNAGKKAALIGISETSDVDALIKAAGCSRVELDPIRHLQGTITDALQQVTERKTVLQHEIGREKRAMDELTHHRPFLEESEELLSVELLKAQAPLYFGTTEYVTIIRGYVPVRAAAQLENSLPQAVISFHETEDAPTLLRNPPVFRTFEEFLTLYSLPKYSEIDPTSILAISFPVFFGFMLGDVGYGLVLFFLFFAIYHAYPAVKGFAEIVMVSAASSILFGALFGEVFGLDELFGQPLPSLLHRMGNTEQLMIIAVLMGVVHINLGLLLGMRNEAHEGWFFAFIKKGSWIVLQAGIVAMLGSYGHIPFWQPSLWLSWTLLGLGILGVGVGERLKGLLELPMIISHTLSYIRLAAIGMASVYLAGVINESTARLAANGLFILAAVLAIVGHTVNLALGLMGPFLHSLRLHYVEFFMKFYEGGGVPFTPFGAPR